MTIDAVSFGEFARLVRTSEPTLRKRLPDAPDGVVIERGRNGESYKIDPVAGATWWKSIDQADADARAAREAALSALQFELLGPDTALGAHDIEGLTPGEQAAQLQAELAAIKLGELRGELVRREEFEAVAAAFMLLVREKLENLTDRLRKRAEVPVDVAEALDGLVQRDLHDLADAAAKLEDQSVAQEEGTTTDRAV